MIADQARMRREWLPGSSRWPGALDDLRSLVQKRTRTGVRIEFVKEQLVFSGKDSRWRT